MAEINDYGFVDTPALQTAPSEPEYELTNEETCVDCYSYVKCGLSNYGYMDMTLTKVEKID